MNSDSMTRTLLVLILIALLVLIGQGFSEDNAPPWGRYQVTGMRAGAPVLIRTDTTTGQVWKLELRGGGGRWVAFSEPEPAATGSAPQAARESRTPAQTETPSREIVEPPGAPSAPAAAPAAATPRGAATNQPEDIATYAEALTSPELPADLRSWAATQLGTIDDPRSLEALIPALADPEAKVALAAVEAVVQIDDPRVKQALEAAAQHPDPAVQALARKHLEALE